MLKENLRCIYNILLLVSYTTKYVWIFFTEVQDADFTVYLLYSVMRGSLQKNALQILQLFNSIHCNSFTKAFDIITFRVFVLAVFIVQTNVLQGH